MNNVTFFFGNHPVMKEYQEHNDNEHIDKDKRLHALIVIQFGRLNIILLNTWTR